MLGVVSLPRYISLGAFLFFGSVGLGPALIVAVVRFAWVAAERKYTWWDRVGSV